MTKPGLRTRLYHTYFLFRRPMTLGVRLFVTDPQERVLLVRHGYVPGWHMPGGGVEHGQTAAAAARQELLEEAGMEVTGELALFGVYANRHASRRDHVLVYRCPQWRKVREFVPNPEILEIGFFPARDLPETTTGPTRARIGELLSGRQESETW